MKKFISTLIALCILFSFSTAFAQNFTSIELTMANTKNEAYPNVTWYYENQVISREECNSPWGVCAVNLFGFASAGNTFGQVYGGFLQSLGVFSAGMGLGLTNDSYIRTALFLNINTSFLRFNSVFEATMDRENSQLFYIMTLAIPVNQGLALGAQMRRYVGLGPYVEFHFTDYLSMWTVPGAWDYETSDVNGLFGLTVNL